MNPTNFDPPMKAMERSLQLRQLTDDEIVQETVPSASWNPISNKARLYLVGRVVSQKLVSLNVFRATMYRAMNPPRGVLISMIAENHFLFCFNHVADRNAVMEGSPWQFDGCIVVLRETDGDDVGLSRMNLNWCNFYLHTHDLPQRLMTPEMAMFIGNKMGKFVEMDALSDEATITLRMKVQIDVSKPLIRALKFKTEEGLSCLIRITYEKLPNFCYVCGKLDHMVKGCDIWKHLDELDRKEGDWIYGNWLRAENNGLSMLQTTEEKSGKRKSLSSENHLLRKRFKSSTGYEEHLVVCFSWITTSKYANNNTMNYSFESFPIEKLIHRSSTACKRIKPVEKFFWAEIKDSLNPCTRQCRHGYMSFLSVGDSVYAVANCDNLLSHELSCISLVSPLKKSRTEYKCPMEAGKYWPLIEEIGGLIYVLSTPRHTYNRREYMDHIGFEVYQPLEDRWAPLPLPPRFDANVFGCGWAHIVIGAKLCLSTSTYSCAYDTTSKNWEACTLFVDFEPEHHGRIYNEHPERLEGNSPPFPFNRKAIHYKNNIFLCFCSGHCEESHLMAFQICDGKRAVKVPLFLDGLPSNFDILDLVGLGDEYFALMVLEKDNVPEPGSPYGEDYAVSRDYMTMITFKVDFESGEDGHGALNCTLLSMSTRNVRMGGRYQNKRPVYAFKTVRSQQRFDTSTTMIDEDMNCVGND